MESKTFNEFISEEISLENCEFELYQLLYFSSCENEDQLNEIAFTKIFRKANLRFKNEASIIDIFKSGGKDMRSLIIHAIKAFSGDENSKAVVKEIANKKVSMRQVLDFLFKLDDATLHIITGPLHTIAALTGWNIIEALTKMKNKEGEKPEGMPKKNVKNIISNLKNALHTFPAKSRRRALVFVDKLTKTLKVDVA